MVAVLFGPRDAVAETGTTVPVARAVLQARRFFRRLVQVARHEEIAAVLAGPILRALAETARAQPVRRAPQKETQTDLLF